MNFRHEWKHQIDYAELLALRARLPAVMAYDSHARNGQYEIRSLYFDNAEDKALREKLDGVNGREKYRIRYYNGDTSFMLLEKKSKINGLCSKAKTRLSFAQAQAIAAGDMRGLASGNQPLVQELRFKMETQGLRPKTIVQYTREPFVYPAGNVRVTLDHHIRTGMTCTDFLNPNCILIPAGRDFPILLEVKWDAFLPSVIRDLVQIPAARSAAFSKYAACRVYG